MVVNNFETTSSCTDARPTTSLYVLLVTDVQRKKHKCSLVHLCASRLGCATWSNSGSSGVASSKNRQKLLLQVRDSAQTHE